MKLQFTDIYTTENDMTSSVRGQLWLTNMASYICDRANSNIGAQINHQIMHNINFNIYNIINIIFYDEFGNVYGI